MPPKYILSGLIGEVDTNTNKGRVRPEFTKEKIKHLHKKGYIPGYIYDEGHLFEDVASRKKRRVT